ncbi:hypothetical protein F2Q68_00038164 [Brassica cretica]|uniref:Uncharacterized protein n=1 Tax=Brassica cretica TaxID=69181 RepID=A0A8S9MLH1_BRACR|nr:hypothetical protein F2Q68_00038164 [Brassica cretica]
MKEENGENDLSQPRWEEVDINFSKKDRSMRLNLSSFPTRKCDIRSGLKFTHLEHKCSCCRNSMVEKDLSRPCREEICIDQSTKDSFNRLFASSIGSLRCGNDAEHFLEIEQANFG